MKGSFAKLLDSQGLGDDGDCYSVKREPDGRFLVKHFPNKTASRPCCQMRAAVSDRDRANAIPDADPHGEAACLRRIYLALERKHAEQVATV